MRVQAGGQPAEVSDLAVVRPPDALLPAFEAGYRRKRLVAGVLTGTVFLAVPALIVLLLVFG